MRIESEGVQGVWQQAGLVVNLPTYGGHSRIWRIGILPGCTKVVMGIFLIWIYVGRQVLI
jgi:hypothetical protein